MTLAIGRRRAPPPCRRCGAAACAARRHVGRRRRQLRAVLGARGARGAVPLRPEGPARGRADRRARSDRLRLALLPAGRAARRCCTATACTGPMIPSRAIASIRTRCCWTRTRDDRGTDALVRRQFRLPRRQSPRGSLVRHARQRVRHAEEPGRRLRVHLGRRSRRRASRGRTR